MKTTYQDQVNRIKIQLNEKTELFKPPSTSTMGGPDIGAAIEAERKRQEDPEYQKRTEKEIAAYVGETEARKKIPGIEGGRDFAARIAMANLNSPEVAQATRASITRAEREGRITPEQAKEKRNLTREKEKEQESRERTDKLLRGLEVGADVAGAIANTGLIFSSGGIAAPALGPKVVLSASKLGQLGFASQAGVDFYRAAMTDNPEEKAQYTSSGLQKAAGVGIGVGIGASLKGAQKLNQLTKTTEDLKLLADMYRAKASANIPGAARVFQLGDTIKKATQATSSSDAGGIGGGLAGTALGYSLITPEDNMATATAKVVGSGIVGMIAGRKGVGWLQEKLPKMAIPLATGGAKGKATKLISQELEKIGTGQKPLIVQGFTRIPDRTQVTPGFSREALRQVGTPKTTSSPVTPITPEGTAGRVYTRGPDGVYRPALWGERDFSPRELTPGAKAYRRREEGGLVPSDEPIGIWQPNPEAQGTGTGLARRSAATQDVGYPRYPETHVGRVEQEVLTPRPLDPGEIPPPPVKRVQSTATDPNKPTIMWGVRGTKPSAPSEPVTAPSRQLPELPKTENQIAAERLKRETEIYDAVKKYLDVQDMLKSNKFRRR